MQLKSITQILLAAGLALGATVASAGAQSYDGNHQVRVGAFLMGGGAKGNLALTTSTGVTTTGDYSAGLVGLGATAGLEWVHRGHFTWGLEVDGAALSGNDTINAHEVSQNYLASLRARFGVFLRDNLVWYGTVGVAGLGYEIKTETTSLLGGTALTKHHRTKAGLAAGTGFEWDFGPGLVFGEYMFTGFGDIEGPIGTRTFKADADIHAVRIGVKFKVGHDHYAYDDDVARRIGRPTR
jgi:opacity protein-like surface antigen